MGTLALGNYMGAQLGRSLAAVAAAGAVGVTGGGFLRDDVDQIVMDLAVARDMILLGHYSQVALFDETGAFMGLKNTISPEEYRTQQIGHPDWTGVGVWGGAPLEQLWPGSTDASGNATYGMDEAVRLGRAIDGLLQRIASAPTSDTAPSGTPNISQNVIAPILLVIVVAGIAATIVGGAYVWKKFDPELNRDLAAIRAAADAYRLRIETFSATGKMPPAGPLEAATASYVRSSADKRYKRELLVGGALLLGTGLAVGAGAYVLKKKYRRAA